MWIQHEDFLDVVKDTWGSSVERDPFFKVVQKLKAVKIKLKKWNLESFCRIDKKVESLCSQMFQIQDARRLNLDDDTLAIREQEVIFEYLEALKLEENLLRQKARIKWLELGDGNNKFFHRSMIIRRSKNNIRRIETNDGRLIEEEDAVRAEAKKILPRDSSPCEH